MWRIASACALVLGVACGPSKPAPAGAGPDVRNTAPADAMPPPSPGCPDRFDQAGGACDVAVASQQCFYPEGQCYCGITPRCSGAVMDPDLLAEEPTAWQCTAKPPEIRDDGCPGVQRTGAACSDDGKRCTYGSCCVNHVVCRGGRWVDDGGECPP